MSIWERGPYFWHWCEPCGMRVTQTHECPAPDHAQRGLNETPTTYGLCLHCQSIEVALNSVTGTRDLSSIGESDTYPTGYGCEMCA